MCDRNNLSQFVTEKLSQPSDAVADDVVQQLARQLSDPMPTISQQRSSVVLIFQVIAKVAFNVDGFTAKNSLSYELARLKHLGRELKIMSSSDLEVLTFGQRN